MQITPMNEDDIKGHLGHEQTTAAIPKNID